MIHPIAVRKIFDLRQLPPRSARKWLRQAFLMQTSNADTHPCLRDRLVAIGFSGGTGDAAPPPPPAVNAAEQLLHDALPACIRALEIRWETGVKPQWAMRFKQAEKDRQRLTELRAKSERRALTANEQCEQAALVLELDGDEHAGPLFKQALQKSPDHAQSNFLFGRLLIEADDETGIVRSAIPVQANAHVIRRNARHVAGAAIERSAHVIGEHVEVEPSLRDRPQRERYLAFSTDERRVRLRVVQLLEELVAAVVRRVGERAVEVLDDDRHAAERAIGEDHRSRRCAPDRREDE